MVAQTLLVFKTCTILVYMILNGKWSNWLWSTRVHLVSVLFSTGQCNSWMFLLWFQVLLLLFVLLFLCIIVESELIGGGSSRHLNTFSNCLFCCCSLHTYQYMLCMYCCCPLHTSIHAMYVLLLSTTHINTCYVCIVAVHYTLQYMLCIYCCCTLHTY